MIVLNTRHKQKSAAITVGILVLLIFGLFNFGLDYLDPPAEYGVAINFGDAAIGSGPPVAVTKKSTPKKSERIWDGHSGRNLKRSIGRNRAHQ